MSETPLGLDALADEVWEWHLRELGEGTLLGKVAKVGEEAGELIGHTIKSTEPRPDAAEHHASAVIEVADVILAVLGAARALGIESVDDVVREKWAIVRDRRFATAPCHGKVGSKPEWVGSGQWDGGCACVLPNGHYPGTPHACTHTAEVSTVVPLDM